MTPEQRANRIKVITLLRDRSKWPIGFKWNFSSTNSRCGCAIPLVKEVLNFYPHFWDDTPLGLSRDESYNIFMWPGNLDYAQTKNSKPYLDWEQWRKDWDATTPEDVARKLEATL